MSTPPKPARKPRKRAPKPDQAPSPKPKRVRRPKAAQPPDPKAKVEPAVTPPAAVAAPAAVAMRPAAPANTPSIDFQTIATAYGDYTRKSFELTRSFVEKLAGVRSLDQAIEIQTEFVKQAYEAYMTEAQKICEFYSGLARQPYEAATTQEPAAR